MLLPIIKQLNSKRIVLASGSIRRQDLLKTIGLNVELCPSLFEEDLDPKDFADHSEFVKETALQKVLEVSNRLEAELASDVKSKTKPDIIIGADTMVVFENELYGKPKDKDDAYITLSKLMGKSCTVRTGVAVKYGNEICKFVESADVCFGKATSEQIRAYVDTGDPLDKAGSFAIQSTGGTFVRAIDGDYYTVLGLPLYRLCTELIRLFEVHK